MIGDLAPLADVGLVAIGRNEGERLRNALTSAVGKVAALVYVDSGSTDGSVEMAKAMGANVVELDLSTPFTAARARNEGFARLLQLKPDIEFVQFIDGDCEIAPDWLVKAEAELRSDEKLAVVCGRRRERFPEASIYNRLCDVEWDTPIGDALACGGDAMIRASALRAIGGYNGSVIAGEEPEMCLRLRQAGWKIRRIDAEMTLHDAAMTRFGQWWKRTVRAGHAYAEGAAMHGKTAERHWVRETRNNWVWGVLLPVLAIALAWPTRGISLVLLLGYLVLAAKVYRGARRRPISGKAAAVYAASCAAGKVPQAMGQLKYWAGRISGKRSGIIEYKDGAAQRAGAAATP